MNRQVWAFVHTKPITEVLVFGEEYIGAPNQRDCFTLAKRVIESLKDYPKGTHVSAALWDGDTELSTDEFILD